ncbi:MAG: flippase-like domain-containing protein [Fibrobacter sp.]|jgi:uncharacterized protein (TIRG00374 family)|nr:flippase-like domain-containing protein [Fibrobacter sp.]
MKHRLSKIILKIIRIVAVVLPFIWILSKIEFSKLIAAFNAIQGWTIPLTLSVILITMFLQGLRWWLLLRAFDQDLSFTQTISYHFKSLFYSLVLPTSAAQEVVRTLLIVKKTGSSVSWSTAWICKITGLVVSFAFSIYGLILLSDSAVSATLVKAALILFIAICILVIFSFSKKLTKPFRNLASKAIPSRYLSKVENLREAIYQFRYRKKCVLLTIFITTIIQFLLISVSAMIIKGITGSFFPKECFAYIPLIEIISMAQPLTPNGMGVREALSAMMFKHLGLSSEQLGVYILICNLLILMKLAGAVPILWEMIFNYTNKKNYPRVPS